MTNSAGPEFVLGGGRVSTSMRNQGTSGVYWSSTAYSSAIGAYFLGLSNSGSVNPANYDVKYKGFSLRCLAEKIWSVSNSQTDKKGKQPSTHTIYQLLTDSAGPNLVLSGDRLSTSMYGQGTRGRYWSSTAYSSATRVYNLYLNNSGAVYPANYDNKYDGYSLRCLALLHPHHLPTTY